MNSWWKEVMKGAIRRLLVVYFLVFTFLAAYNQACAEGELTGIIKRVIDGDSLVVSANRKDIEIRLYGIDCPEYGQSFSSEAKNFLITIGLGEKVKIVPQYYDSYDRLVAIVEKEGETINGAIVEAGMGWVSQKYCRKKVCSAWKKMENLAKENQLGLWAAKTPVPPWKWKKAKRMRRGD